MLAYDASSEVELKCIAGSDDVTAIAETVANSRDYGMLERLVTAISSKEKTLFSAETCQKLLLMIVHSSDELSTRRVALMNKTLGCLILSQDPDVPLWNSILSAVKRFGWNSLSQSVTSLLNRKSNSDRKARQIGCTSKITLKVCLNRVVFLLNLGELGGDGSSFVQDRIAECMTDLNNDTNGKDVYGEDVKEATSKIMSLVTRFGWEQMSNVVKHSLAFISSKGCNTISSTLAVGELVMRLHAVNNCNITQDALRGFAGKFASVLQSHSYYIERDGFNGAEKTSFLKGIELLLKFGTQKELDAAGKAFVTRSKIFSAMLKALSGEMHGIDSQVLLRDILNKCLVQQHTPAQGGWEKEIVSNNKGLVILPPSPMHIYKVLNACPNLVSVADEQDRLTLHYAAGRTASYETIECIFQADQKAASVRDSTTGLYPFMAAGSNGNISASFELLRANPNLVVGGIQASVDDEENEKKRKRSSSMERG